MMEAINASETSVNFCETMAQHPKRIHLLDNNCFVSNYKDLSFMRCKLMECSVFNSNESAYLAPWPRYIYGCAEISNMAGKQV
jgi:hypothetical protein